MNLKRVFDLGVFIAFFFVLSSYLITRILLDAKRKAIDKGYGKWKVGVAFLIRRTLRIFPAYYLYLLLLIVLPFGSPEVRAHAGMFFGYLSNVLIYIQKTWGPLTGHLWTLAVEEQFYIFWPWLILFIPTRHLPKLFLFLIIAAVGFRVVEVGFMRDYIREIFPMLSLTPAALDSFAAGGFLAFAHYNGYTQRSKWLDGLVLVILPVWVLLVVTNHRRTFIAVDRLFVSVYAVAILHKAHRGYHGFFGRLLANPVIQYLSKISYGIYLYHMLAAVFFWKLFGRISDYFLSKGNDLTPLRHTLESPYINFWFNLLFAIALASLSWYLVEHPFNKAKKLFAYVQGRNKSR